MTNSGRSARSRNGSSQRKVKKSNLNIPQDQTPQTARKLKQTEHPANVQQTTSRSSSTADSTRHLAQGASTKSKTTTLEARAQITDVQALQLKVNKSEGLSSKVKATASKPVESSFRRVPLEILQEIAFHAKPTRPSDSYNPSLAPLQLAHVCRIWRLAVLGFPPLWRVLSISVDLRTISKASIEKYTTMIGEWFKMTGSNDLALRMQIFTSGGFEDNVDLFTKHLVKPLRSIFLRVKKLSIVSPSAAVIVPLFAGKCNNLRALAINSAKPISMKHAPTLFCDRLERLNLEAPFRFKNFAKHTFPWSRITSLSIKQTINLAQYNNILLACRRLHTASIRILKDSEPPPTVSTNLYTEHRKLEKLSIVMLDKDFVMGTAFAVCTFLSLRILEVGHIGAKVDDPNLSIIGYPCCLTSLEKLSVYGDWKSSLGVLYSIMVAGQRTLNDLHVYNGLNPAKIFEVLSSLITKYRGLENMFDSDTDSEEEEVGVYTFLPFLTALSIDLGSVDADEVESLLEVMVEMLEVRTSDDLDPDGRLQTLRISSDNEELRDHIREAADPFVAVGLSLELYSNALDLTPSWCQALPDSDVVARLPDPVGWW